ncbi:hypothetical protein [Renibacterium salmoninarum]|nr:hypothetical protein [Renibacterium salmoninarum]
MQRITRFLSIISALALTLVVSIGIASPAQANSGPPYNYECTSNAGLVQNWNDKDPYTCVGYIDVFNSTGAQVEHVKDGANSAEAVDCSFGKPDQIIDIFTPSEIIGWGLAEYIWEDS